MVVWCAGEFKAQAAVAVAATTSLGGGAASGGGGDNVSHLAHLSGAVVGAWAGYAMRGGEDERSGGRVPWPSAAASVRSWARGLGLALPRPWNSKAE